MTIRYALVGAHNRYSRLQDVMTNEPVLPIADERTLTRLLHALSATAIQLEPAGGGTHEVDSAESIAATSLVGYLDDDLRQAAELYAHLTSRRAARLCVAQEMTSEGLEVIVLRSLGSHLIDLAVECSIAKGFAIGIVCGDTDDQLILNVLKSACTHGRAMSPTPSVCELRDDLVVGKSLMSGRILLGRRSTARDVMEELGSAHTLTILTTHSDGIDAKLGREAVLCAVTGHPNRPSSTEGAPFCVSSNYCSRLAKPLDEALSDERLIRASQVRAGVLVMDVCFGVLHAGGGVRLDWGLAQQIEASAQTAVNVYHLNLRQFRRSDTADLINRLVSGATLGDAFGEFMANDSSRLHSTRYILVGDPQARLCDRPSGLQKIPVLGDGSPPKATSLLEFLLEAASSGAAARSDTSASPATESASDLSGHGWEVDHSTWKSVLQRICDDRRGWHALHSTQVDMSVLSLEGASYGSLCPNCGSSTSVRHVRVYRDLRRLSRCEHCGYFDDLPVGDVVTLEIDAINQQIRVMHKLNHPIPAEVMVAQKGRASYQLLQTPDLLHPTKQYSIGYNHLMKPGARITAALIYARDRTIGLMVRPIRPVHLGESVARNSSSDL